jgi:hypothetical protein
MDDPETLETLDTHDTARSQKKEKTKKKANKQKTKQNKQTKQKSFFAKFFIALAFLTSKVHLGHIFRSLVLITNVFSYQCDTFIKYHPLRQHYHRHLTVQQIKT